MSRKDERVVLSAWVDPVLRDYAKESARVSGLQFSRWVERAVQQAVSREAVFKTLGHSTEEGGAVQRNAILRACAALLDASCQIDDSAKADIWRDLAADARAQFDRLMDERRMFRRRLVECRPWVGVCPLAADGIQEVSAVRDLADDTLTEVPE